MNNDLPISRLTTAIDLDGHELVPFAKDNANGAFSVALLKEIIREGLATQSSLNGKQNKLTSGHGIKITPDNVISTDLDLSPMKVVEVLPTADIENKIYLVPDPEGQAGKNEYVEYLWTNDHWEVLGKFTPAIDLAPYLKAADAERIYQKRADMPNMEEYVKLSVVNALAQTVSALTTQVANIKTKIDTIPAIPITDGKCYALKDGAWEIIADTTESVAVVNQDFDEASEVRLKITP